MTSFKVHVVFVVPAADEDGAVEVVNYLLAEGEAATGDYDVPSGEVDWDIVEVWDYDDEEDDEDLVDEW